MCMHVNVYDDSVDGQNPAKGGMDRTLNILQ